MSFAIVAGAAVIGGGVFSYLGAREQAKATKQATQTLAGQKSEEIQLAREVLEEGRPTREAASKLALGAFPLLQQDISRVPGTGAEFTVPLKRGLQSLSPELGQYGATLAQAPGLVGSLTEGLLAQDIQNLREARFRAAGFAPKTLEPGLKAFGKAGEAATDIAELQGYSPMAGLYGDLGSTAGFLGSLALTRGLG
jgi:hypothetical protein